MYNERVMKEFQSPQNVGEVKGANAVGKAGSAACGDILKIFMRINEQEVIEDVSFQTFGCAAAIASSSVITELIKGKTINEALKITNKQVVDELGGLPPQKIHCSVLAEEAIREAVDNYLKNYKKQNLA